MVDPGFKRVLLEAAKGDNQALARLYAEFLVTVKKGLKDGGARPEDIDHLANAAFYSLFKALDRGKILAITRSGVGAWLKTTAKRLALSERKAAAGREREHPAFSDPKEAALEPGLFSAPGFEEALIREDVLAKAVARLQAELPDRHRQWWYLRTIEGWSFEEIAEDWGCPTSTIRSALSRYGKKLSRVVESLVASKPKRRR